MTEVCMFDMDPVFEDYKCPYLKAGDVCKTCKELGCVMYREYSDDDNVRSIIYDSAHEFKKLLVTELNRMPAEDIKKFVVETMCNALFGQKKPDWMKDSNTYSSKPETKSDGDSQ